LKQLAKDLHAEIFRSENLSIERLASIIDALETIYEDIYPELLLEILTIISSDVNAIELSFLDTLSKRFHQLVQQRWEFNFKPGQMGLTKATTFVKLRGR
jgi:hypothetical protein